MTYAYAVPGLSSKKLPQKRIKLGADLGQGSSDSCETRLVTDADAKVVVARVGCTRLH